MLLKKLFKRDKLSDKISEEVTYADLAILGLIIIVGAVIGFRKFGNNQPKPEDKTTYGVAFSQTPIAELPTAKDSQVVELKNGDIYNLTASIVKKQIGNSVVKMLAYNGMIPGPLIKVSQGAEVTLNFTNNTDVDTTIHSHGVRLDNKFDGVPDVTQKAVRPGESFTYKIKFPDAGMYWYHPHIREDYAQELGLYGNYLVTPNDPHYWSPVNRETALFLDDILIENGRIATFNKATADHTLMGRFGNTMLVNGETDYELVAKIGEVVRFYLTNSANTRTLNVKLPGAKMKLVGGDGGKYEREQYVDSVLLGPSERAVVEVLFDKAGKFSLIHQTPDKTYTLGTIDVSTDKIGTSYAKEFDILRTNQDIISSIDPLRPYFGKPADKSLVMAVNMMGRGSGMGGQHMMGNGMMMGNSAMTMPGDVKKIEWEDDMGSMNINSTSKTLTWQLTDQATGNSNMDIDWKFKVGDKVKVKIFNDPNAMHPMQHPIHFHGQRFLVLSTNGVKNDNLVWKDTALVQTGDTVELLVDMTNPGTWMAHCHIAEHLESGMMMKFEVL